MRPTDATQDGQLQAGTVITGRYRLERPVGTGGMATIWEATHLSLNRGIAIKFIDLIGPHTPKVRDRFLREARVAAAVRHRNVVDILDFGTTEEGRPFMAMELLVGRTLADRMNDSQPISVGEAVRIVACMLSGLAAVHDEGIIHRDLKPENVFLVEDADGVFPKLLDFGVSRAVDPGNDLKSVLPTVENAIVGTPQYMSPEQARGLTNIDARSDLWSVGVILFELLTGQLPFDSDAVGDLIIQIATEEPPDFALLRPDLVGPIERVVKTAMARSPEDRYPDARRMRSELLSAVSRTAAELQAAQRSGAMGRRGGPHVDTLPEPAALEPRELMDAVGDAYEPGDSGVVDMSEYGGWFGDAPEPTSGLRTRPLADAAASPPNVRTRTATLGRAEVAPTSGVAPRNKRASRLLLSGLAGAIALAAAAIVFDRVRPYLGEGIQATPLSRPEQSSEQVTGFELAGDEEASRLPQNLGISPIASVEPPDGLAEAEVSLVGDSMQSMSAPEHDGAERDPERNASDALSSVVPMEGPAVTDGPVRRVESVRRVVRRSERRRARRPRRVGARGSGAELLRDPGF